MLFKPLPAESFIRHVKTWQQLQGQEPGPKLFYTGINDKYDQPGKAGSAAWR